MEAPVMFYWCFYLLCCCTDTKYLFAWRNQKYEKKREVEMQKKKMCIPNKKNKDVVKDWNITKKKMYNERLNTHTQKETSTFNTRRQGNTSEDNQEQEWLQDTGHGERWDLIKQNNRKNLDNRPWNDPFKLLFMPLPIVSQSAGCILSAGRQVPLPLTVTWT